MQASRRGSVCLALALAAGGVAAGGREARAGTGQEQERFADEAVTSIEASATDVRRQLLASRSRRDPAGQGCLNAALTELEGVARQAAEARGVLRRASLREDMDAMAQSSAALARLNGRAAELRQKGQECRSSSDGHTGQKGGGEGAGASATTLVETEKENDGRVMYLEVTAPPDEGFAAMRDDHKTRSPQASFAGAARGMGAGPPPATPAPGAPASTPSIPFAPTPAPTGSPSAPPAASPYAADTAHEASMLAYSADFTLAVFQVDKGLASVEAMARELGGYLAQRGDEQMTVRVPRPRFEEAIARLEKLGDVLHRNVSAEDVTDEYVDLDLRLKNSRAMRDQLAALLKGASVKEAVEIQKELAKVTEVIEQMEGRMKVMRDKVGYSSITVSFQAVQAQASQVRSTAILPFAWLDTMGLAPLLDVPKVQK